MAERLAILGGPRAVARDELHRSWPEVLPEDIEAVQRVLRSGNFAGPHADEITALQREYAAYVGSDYCVALNSGTAALHCCVAAVGVQPGDEVIVPAYTFIASAMAVAHQGGVPVFCDVDARTYNIDPGQVEPLVSERTKAIMAVHIHGQPADLDELRAVADRHDLALIEDNAQAHGISYRGRMTGGIGDCSGTSLNQSKNLSAGEGGLFLTNDPEMFRVARRLAVFGEDIIPLEVRAFWSHGVGWNYRNQELSSAFARSQLRRLDRFNERAQANALILSEAIRSIPWLTPPYVADDRGCSYWKYMVQLDPERLGFEGPAWELRERVMETLKAEGVESMVWQPQPVPAQVAFRRDRLSVWQPSVDRQPARSWDPGDFPVASRLVDVSFAVGTEKRPLYVQDAGLMEQYAAAIHKVVDNIEDVVSMPFTPRTLVREGDLSVA